MKVFLVLFLFFGSFQQPVPADSISLQYCYEQAEENYPIAKNMELQEKITDLNVSIAQTGYYPQVSVDGKASYQSEVTDISLPGGMGPPAVSKDQYEASVSVTQKIFNGGAVGIRKKIEKTKGKQEIHSTEVELHQIRSQVDQVYFGILLSQQQSKVNGLLIEELQERLKSVRSQVKNGVLLSSQQYILEAELIKARQDSASIESNIRANYQVLSELIGQEVDSSIALILPELEVGYQSLQPMRAEYDLFESTRRILKQQKELAETKKMPSISAYGSAMYGRPGLNFLNDDFHDYYMVGLKLRWNLFDFLNSNREMQALQIQQRKVTRNQQAFTKQLEASIGRMDEQISSLRENIERDKEIIGLRNKIVKESASQLDNGVITATEYVTELTQANKARLSLFINRVQLAEVQVKYLTTLGVPLQSVTTDK
ncbi:TolC family protein [Fodinibius sp. Rm-B-1B1-1]|uniref:TolC family protein n=1 Tax=Fodinibius alkaliphilus TaxID=3140241 RepID=UPI00315A83C6